MQEVLKENEKNSILTFWESITVTLREEFTGAAQSKDLLRCLLLTWQNYSMLIGWEAYNISLNVLQYILSC